MKAESTPKPTLAALKREVNAMRDPQRGNFLQSFFRTGPGQYAEGDKMVGLTVPACRLIARAFRDRTFQDVVVAETRALLTKVQT